MGALADALVARGGYNRTDAENAERGPRAADLSREFLGGSSSGGGSSYADLVAEQQRIRQNAIQPVVDNLNKSKGIVSQGYAQTGAYLKGQVDPLKERYDNLISSIRGDQTKSENRQTMTTNNELAARGIVSGGGLYNQTMTDAVNPVTQEYSALVKDTGIQKEADLQDLLYKIAGLTTQENQDINTIDTQIAQLLAGQTDSALTSGLQLYQTQEQIKQAQAQQALAERELQARLDAAKKAGSGGTGFDFEAILKALQTNTGGTTQGQNNLDGLRNFDIEDDVLGNAARSLVSGYKSDQVLPFGLSGVVSQLAQPKNNGKLPLGISSLYQSLFK